MYRISLEGVMAYADRFAIHISHGYSHLIAASITGPDTVMKTWQAVLRSQGAKNRNSMAMIYAPEKNYTRMVYLEGMKDNDQTTIITTPIQSQNRKLINIFAWCQGWQGSLYPVADEGKEDDLPDIWNRMMLKQSKIICCPEWGPLVWPKLKEQELVNDLECVGLAGNQVLMAEAEIQEIISAMVAEGTLQ